MTSAIQTEVLRGVEGFESGRIQIDLAAQHDHQRVPHAGQKCRSTS